MTTELVQKRIERLRISAGLDRKQLADRCGLSTTAVWNWETNGTATKYIPKEKP
jgi:transcriptional regulator with XRE-family HTH domain